MTPFHKAIIIDDEILGAQSLEKMLHYAHPDIQIAGLAHSGKQGKEMIATHSPDLIFLDIRMMDMSGFDMLEELDIINFDIIFTTAHNEYALKAFRCAAIDYLLKPIDADELSEALDRFRKKHMQPSVADSHTQFETLFKQLADKEQLNDRLVLPTQQGLVFMKTENIIRLQSSSNYTIFYIKDRKPITVSKTMGEFEDTLLQHTFFRIHHSHIINLCHVDKYIKGEGGYVVMNDGSELDVSRRKKDEFLQKFEHIILGK